MIRLPLLVLLIAAAGCRSRPLYRAPVSPDPQATYAAVAEDGRQGIPAEDEALWACEMGSAALAVGAEAEAFRALDRAARIMGTLESTSAENARAIFGQEATKTWKGDPHERCMNALYKGLLYWRRGDLENASACFKRGLLADAWSEAGEHQTDFAVLSYLLGWVSSLRGKTEQANFSFQEALDHNPDNPYFADPRPDRDNVLVVADVAFGPEKYAGGPHGSVAMFAQQGSAVHGIELLVDGKARGRSHAGTQLYVQAVTRGDKVIDGIRKGKAIFKEGTHIAGVITLYEGIRRGKDELVLTGVGLLLISALTSARADTRYWSQLPGEIHVLPLAIEPGPHRLEVRALDANGNPLPGWRGLYDVVVPQRWGTLYWFRAVQPGVICGLTGPSKEERP